ncbi:carbohydrate sulfotransferase 11-like isoform X2 [Diachasmimorpha longicaudata]|uniref:carbohydrate sulfotransferase 11-like isoform X2 n=1 Tax=Diachasmimorpha longicaudata TaxID=58733 RepID=UPI0030B8F88A
MTLEGNLLMKSSSRGFHHLVNVRRVTFIMGIFLLMILAIYHYISVKERHLNELIEYQVVVESDISDKDEMRIPLTTSTITTIPTIPNINYEMKGTEEMETEFLRRGDHVKQKCKELGLMGGRNYVPQSNPQNFIINYDYHVIYCSVFKAASTSWLYNMNLLAGIPADDLQNNLKISPMTMTREKYKRPLQSELLQALDNNLSFLIVRHPFARLVRTYYDKFMLEGDEKFYQEVGQRIIERTRLEEDLTSKLKPPISENLPPTFKQTDLPPTFEELVKFVLCEWRDNKLQNEHWKPITKFCTPCQVPFDYIIKFETLEEEQQVLIERANLQEVLKPQWEDNSSIEDLEDLEQEYFSQLSKQQILDLHEYYNCSSIQSTST